MIETYDNLEWEIPDIPIGSSTPDDLFELSFNAYSECPECGSKIHGTANYWSRDPNMIISWLNDIQYDPCCCTDDEEEEDEDNEDEIDEEE